MAGLDERSVDDIVDRIFRAEEPRAVWQLLRDHMHGAGFGTVFYVHSGLLAGEPGPSRNVRADGFPEAWLRGYRAGRRWRSDPFVERALQTAAPFRWEDLALEVANDDVRRAAFRETTEVTGVVGLGIGVYGPVGRNGYVGLGGIAAVPSAAECRRLAVAGQAAHSRLCVLHGIGARRTLRLTPRELDVLRGMAQGRSNAGIGAVLGISFHTVDTVVRRVYAKLGVSDRTAAAVQGLALGVLTCDDLERG